MRIRESIFYSLIRILVVFVLVLLSVLPVSSASAAFADGVNGDTPALPAVDPLQRFVGVYVVAMPNQQDATMTLRVFELGGSLFGQINQNEPTRLLRVRDGVFRPEAANAFLLTFALDGDQSGSLTINSPDGTTRGVRLAKAETRSTRDVAVDPSRSGTLYDELARADNALFQAAFVACDAARVYELFVDDIEFYHDQTGLSVGNQVRQDFKRLTANCPGKHGVTRELIAGSLQVFPMKDGYAVQMGEHRFLRAGEPAGTVARFVHLWQKKNNVWRLARVLSFDHRPESGQ